MNFHVSLLSIPFSMLLLAPGAQAATHYLAPNGVDSNTCGAFDAPCKSLKRALKTSSGSWRLGVGDQVLFMGGTYVVNEPAANPFSVEYFSPDRNTCLTPNAANKLRIGVDPKAQSDVLIEMGPAFADASLNPGRNGALLRIVQSNCVLVDGDNGYGRRMILDGRERRFDISNPYYDAYAGGPIPGPNVAQPKSTALVNLVDYSGLTATRHTNDLIFGGVSIRNLEVRNTMGAGISFNKYRDLDISNNYVHHTFFRAIGGYGYNVTIADNRVHNAGQINRNNVVFYARQDNGGWPGIVQAGSDYEFRDFHGQSGKVYFRNNLIQNSWGEGIIASTDQGEVSGNTVANTYSIGIYVERGANLKVEKNYVYANDALYHRPIAATPYIPPSSTPDPYRRALDGVTLATESANNPASSLIHDVAIVNNLLVGGRRGITYWYDSSNTSPSNSYANLDISHNTILATGGDHPVRIFALGPNVPRYTNNKIYNNLIEKSAGGSQWRIDDAALWTVGGNYSFAFGAYQNEAFQGPSLTPGSAPVNFSLTANSPALTTYTVGTNITNVVYDFFNRGRNSKPSPGAIEYCGFARCN